MDVKKLQEQAHIADVKANAAAKIADVKAAAADKIVDLKEIAAEKVAQLKEKAGNSEIAEKVKGFADSAMAKGADLAENLADKLRK